jgi:hypothetical protein
MQPVSRNAAGMIVLGALVAGTLDIVYAIGFWAIKAGVAAMRILQSVAAGVLGEASFSGGISSAALGLVLHYAIMCAMVGAYFLLARHWAPLRERSLLAVGAIYGLALYTAMTYVVVPLSAAGQAPEDMTWITCSIAMHILVGVLCAWFARRALLSR